MSVRRLVMLRHGQTEWNAGSRMQGQLDTDLTELGREQAAHAAEVLAKRQPLLIVSSDLRRALDTAKALGERSGQPVEIDTRLRETHLGDWQGLTHHEVDDVAPGARLALGIAFFVVFVAAWSLATFGGFVSKTFLADPATMLRSGYTLLTQQGFGWDIGWTVWRVFGGFVIAAVLALPLGVAMGAYKPIEAFFEPFVSFARYLPASAFIPLLILWAGIGEAQKLALIFIGPKELPTTMRTVGRWVGRVRAHARHFTSGIENMMREAELEEMENEEEEEGRDDGSEGEVQEVENGHANERSRSGSEEGERSDS